MTESLHLSVLQDDELLVGGRLKGEGEAALPEDLLQLFRHGDGMLADAEVQIIREEGIELHAQQAALGQQRAVLLDGVHKMRRFVSLREDDRLTAEGADLGTADVEDIAEGSQVRQGEVRGGAGQAVAQARAVNEQQEAVLPAEGGDGLQIRFGIEGAVFGRPGQVNHAGLHHVLPGFIRGEAGKVGSQVLRADAAFLLGEGKHLVAGILHSAGLMDADVSGFSSDDAAPGGQHGRDDQRVGLGAAGEKFHVRFRPADGRADLFLRTVAVFVRAVAGKGLEVGFRQAAQDIRMRTGDVIAFKGQHIVFLRLIG